LKLSAFAACPRKNIFGGLVAPWFVRNAAKGKSGFLYRVAFQFDAHRDGDKRERVGESVADFEISVIFREALPPEAPRP